VTATLLVDDVVRIASHHRLRWEEAQGCYVLLYPEGIVQLNETAAEILRRCEHAEVVASIVREVQTLYPEESVEEDVRAFLEEAISHGWVSIERA
jgi:pyrroloquinoline quinone biosynthesis protein D